jgi:hypothetical protein
VLLSVTAQTGVTYQWYLDGNMITGAVGSDYMAMQAGAYTVMATSASGCSATSGTAVSVTLNAAPAIPVISSTGSSSFCQGGSASLGFTPEPGVTYQWYQDGSAISGATGNSITVTDSGSYSVVAVNASGCSSTSLPFSIQVFELPQAPVISATGATTFCDGDSVLLSVTAVLGYNYQWTINGNNIPGAVFNQLSVTGPTGSYSVTATDMNGCTSAATLSYIVTVNPLPAAPLITQSNDTLYANPVSGNFQWYLDGTAIPGATGPFWIPVVNGNYSVMVTDTNGCSSASQVYPMVNVGLNNTVLIQSGVYPNPTKGVLSVQLALASGSKAECRLTDISGRIINRWEFVSGSHTIDLGSQAAGMYFLTIESDGSRAVHKVMKE